jgi:hypothetical protein
MELEGGFRISLAAEVLALVLYFEDSCFVAESMQCLEHFVFGAFYYIS